MERGAAPLTLCCLQNSWIALFLPLPSGSGETQSLPQVGRNPCRILQLTEPCDAALAFPILNPAYGLALAAHVNTLAGV